MKKKLRSRAGAAVRNELERLAQRRGRFDVVGKQVLNACNGAIFPGDVYLIGTCNRALQNFDAFVIMMRADFYSTAVVLLRVQLDSLLRCYGLTLTEDPHGTAQAVFGGAKLNKFKGPNGELRDANLVKWFSELSDENKVVEKIYERSSSYVHLSDSAMRHVLMQATKTATGQHKFFIGSREPEVSADSKLQVIHAFQTITAGLLNLALQWTETRGQLGSFDELAARFDPNRDDAAHVVT